MYDKILGCLVGASSGDAMGAATETRTDEQIKELFGGEVRTFLTPPDDVFARGNKAGQVTDDFSLAYISMKTIIQMGAINSETSKQTLIRWGSDSNPYFRMAGPTTKAMIDKLKNSMPIEKPFLTHDSSKATNGLAMKISPLALFSHGDINKALDITSTFGMTSHHNTIAISAASAVAGLTAHAMNNTFSLDQFTQIAVESAEKGEKLAIERGADIIAGPNVRRRIEFALHLVRNSISTDECLHDLKDYIGTGILAYESVPTALALIALYPEDPMEAFYQAVNIGNDTDTMATIVGGIIGTFYGSEIFPKNFLNLINNANDYSLEKLAKEIQIWLN